MTNDIERSPSRRLVWGLLAGLLAAGCNSSAPEPEPKAAANAPAGGAAQADKDKTPAGPAAGGGAAAAAENAEVLLEPFTAPPLAELDAKAQWQDQPVRDSLQLLRAYQAGQKPKATVAEALGLRNTNAEANAKILSALGRLPQSDDEVDWDATINRHSRVEVKSTNPIMVSSVIEGEVSSLMGISLFGFDWNFDMFGAAEVVLSWQASHDHMHDKVVLRDDLTWSDGQPLTAHDVVFSFQTIMNPRVPVPAVRSGTDKLRWVEAYDDHTLVFFHKEALATNVGNMLFPVLPRHIYEKSLPEDYTMQNSEYHVKNENDPVCGGAYVLSKRVRGQELVLTRRESWYMHQGKQVRDKPYFKEVRVRIIEDQNTALLALKKGEIDELMLLPEQWITQTADDEFYEKNTKASGLEWVSFHFAWNIATPFFSDVRVRRAMSFAFNYKELLDKLTYGLYEPSNGMFHRTAWMAPTPPPAPYSQNLEQAETLLDEAGWTDHDGDGVRDKEIDGKLVKFEFSVLCPNIPDRVAICTLLKENLDQIGVVCNVRPLEFTVLQERTLNHEFQAAFGGWGTGADPDTSSNIWATKEGRNFVNYSNPRVDELFVAGRKEFNRAKRAEIYGQIHQLIYADQPYTWLYFRNSFYGFNKQLRGYMFSPRGPYGYGPGFGSIWKPKT